MLRVEGLNVYYGTSHIIQDLSFEIEQGKVACLLGRNGTGKTTLLKALMGLVPMRSGRIWMLGREIGRPVPHEVAELGVAYVPQEQIVFPQLTVLENLTIGMLGMGRGTEIPEHIYDLFPILRERRNQKAGTLSGGQQKILATARALAVGAKLLLLDEPTEGVQGTIVEDMARAIRSLLPEVTVLIVEQNLDMAKMVSDKVLIMNKGRIVHEGESSVVLESEDIVAQLAL